MSLPPQLATLTLGEVDDLTLEAFVGSMLQVIFLKCRLALTPMGQGSLVSSRLFP